MPLSGTRAMGASAPRPCCCWHLPGMKTGGTPGDGDPKREGRDGSTVELPMERRDAGRSSYSPSTRQEQNDVLPAEPRGAGQHDATILPEATGEEVGTQSRSDSQGKKHEQSDGGEFWMTWPLLS